MDGALIAADHDRVDRVGAKTLAPLDLGAFEILILEQRLEHGGLTAGVLRLNSAQDALEEGNELCGRFTDAALPIRDHRLADPDVSGHIRLADAQPGACTLQ